MASKDVFLPFRSPILHAPRHLFWSRINGIYSEHDLRLCRMNKDSASGVLTLYNSLATCYHISSFLHLIVASSRFVLKPLSAVLPLCPTVLVEGILQNSE